VLSPDDAEMGYCSGHLCMAASSHCFTWYSARSSIFRSAAEWLVCGWADEAEEVVLVSP
jgi:hypothetical protein